MAAARTRPKAVAIEPALSEILSRDARERHRHDQSEGSDGQPLLSKDGPQKKEEQGERESKQHGDRRPFDEVAGDEARP